jgi:thymidylate synthase/dihydrofolate reductase
MVKYTLIASVNFDIKTGKLGIGFDEQLPWSLPEDLKRFKKLTENNIVVMGMKTYKIIGPLPNRINYVLTRTPKETLCDKGAIFINSCEEISKDNTKDVYIIGGYDIYLLYMAKCTEILLTVVEGKYECNKYFPEIPCNFELIDYSDTSLLSSKGLKYRYLTYKNNKDQKCFNENEYLNLASNILNDGNTRTDRTGTGTVSLFGPQMTFDISKFLPLLTTKFVSWKTVVHELLWILKGSTKTDYLEENNVKIWRNNTSREFLDSIGKQEYPANDLLFGYGHQLRHSGSNVNGKGGFDQLKYVENLLKTDPFSRRILWNLWNPIDLDSMVLQPCHNQMQFYVTEKNNKKHLSGKLYMRSNDFFLGDPYNLASYGFLIYIMAMKCDMVPDTLIISIGDAHIYSNHIEQIKTQMLRIPRTQPVLIINDAVKNKDYSDITIEDFEVIGYFPCPSIKADMAI